MLCRRAVPSSNSLSSLTSHSDTPWGIISHKLSFFVVEVDLYLAALMKPFDVFLRYGLLFSILFSHVCFNRWAHKERKSSYNASLGCQLFSSPIVALESCHPETSPALKQLFSGELGQRVFHTNDECTRLAPAL